MSLINICNQYINNVKWLNAKAFNFVIDDFTIDVYRINITSNLTKLDKLAAMLSMDEIARANKYFQIKDKNRSIISHGSLRYILGQYLNESPDKPTFGLGVNKKPFIINNTKNIYYNISHSGDWVLIVVAKSETGADIEFINPDFNYHDILDDNFSDTEINHLKNNNTETFFKLWTRKEALTKASGKGLDEDLKLIPSLNGNHLANSHLLASTSNLVVNSFKPHTQYMASVAITTKVTDIRFWDIDFE